MKTLGIVLRTLARLAPVVPDSNSLLPDGGDVTDYLPAVCYAAAAAGVISWDAIKESTGQTGSLSDSEILNELSRIGNLLRVGPNLAADFIKKHEADQSSVETLREEIGKLHLNDERRLHLQFYVILQEIRTQVRQGVAASNHQSIGRVEELIVGFEEQLIGQMRDQNSFFASSMGKINTHVETLMKQGETYESEIRNLRQVLLSVQRQNSTISTEQVLSSLERAPLDVREFLWNKFQTTVANLSERIWHIRARKNSASVKSSFTTHSASSSFASYSALLLRNFLERVDGLPSISAQLVTHCERWLDTVNSKLVEEILVGERHLTVGKIKRILQNGNLPLDTAGFLVALLAEIAEFVDGIPTEESVFEHIERDPAYLNGYMLRAVKAIEQRKKSIDLSEIRDPAASIDSDYKRVMIGGLDHLELLGIENVDPAQTQYRLSIAFIMLILADSEKEVCTEQILGRNKLIAIRGYAGSGKTTLLKWLAVSACSRNFEDIELQKLNGNVPLYVSLRDYRDRALPSTGAICLLRPIGLDSQCFRMH